MSSNSDNIFWKMIQEQKNEKIPTKNRYIITKQTYTKSAKKLNSTILDKIEKVTLNTPSHISLSKKSLGKNKEIQELETIGKLPTFKIIIKFQHLCKEVISKKEKDSALIKYK